MEEALKELLKAIEDLKDKARDGWVIVVEGVKDREALRKLGVDGEIVTFSGFLSTAEKLRDKKVVILTDYDDKGEKIERGLQRALLSYGKTADVELRKRIFCYVKKEITKVEELYAYLVREGHVGV
ncbi:MAG: toprim domain-containing protein [Archaeoglobaceae archaeon]